MAERVKKEGGKEGKRGGKKEKGDTLDFQASTRLQNIDITNFEESLSSFKDAFGRNYKLAQTKFVKAIEDIDKTISAFKKVISSFQAPFSVFIEFLGLV